MPVKRRQIETNRGTYYNKDDRQKYFQMVKVHFSMVMKLMKVIMTMRITMKIMNSSNYIRIFAKNYYKIVSPVLQQELINDFAVQALQWYTVTSSEAVAQRCSVKSILRNLTKFTGKHLCQSLFIKSMFEKLYFCETEIDFI